MRFGKPSGSTKGMDKDFWIYSVLVVLLLNVVASFIVRAVDAALRPLSRGWRQRSDRRRLKRDARIAHAASDVFMFTAMAARATRETLSGMWGSVGGLLLVFSGLFLISGEHWSAWVVRFVGAIVFLSGQFSLYRAWRIADEISAAEGMHDQASHPMASMEGKR